MGKLPSYEEDGSSLEVRASDLQSLPSEIEHRADKNMASPSRPAFSAFCVAMAFSSGLGGVLSSRDGTNADLGRT
jgi:hypothetical protein